MVTEINSLNHIELEVMNSSASLFQRIRRWLSVPEPNAALVTLRLVFGAAMTFSVLRFWYLGWIEDHFVDVPFTFKYYGFSWVKLLPSWGMYALHLFMLLGALGILLGWWYRISAIVFFVTFTYVELIDLTYYLNHYYFVSLVGFWMIWVPANQRFSLDAYFDSGIRSLETPRWTIEVFKWQVGLVYLYAGLAKINYTWLVEAMPLRIWLPASNSLPLIGPLFEYSWVPHFFSWAGMIFDCCIVFLLSYPSTRLIGYLALLFFHGMTGWLFQIGIFPLVMTGMVLVFFSNSWHNRLLSWFGEVKGPVLSPAPISTISRPFSIFLGAYFLFQVLFPWRYLLYPGNLFWTEEGYRFSWRVMLMEKAGTALFFVKDRATGREGVVDNAAFLAPHQEKQMAMQPDMILQYAHFLAQHYREKGVQDPAVRAEVYVTLNGQPGQLLVDPTLDLTQINDSWAPKTWLLQHNGNKK